MQVLVAGMHRSGTSIVTRLLSLAGLYVGTPDELMQGMPDNPGGYWERNDICELNTAALNAVHVDWNTTLGEEIERLGPTQRGNLVHSIRDVIHGLEQHRPWVIKDPRFSVVLPLWKPLLSDPVIVICHRNPLEVAHSLRGRDGMPISIGVALWEVYTLAVLQNTRAMQRILISHEELLSSTHETADKLVSRLKSLDSSGIEMPSTTTIKKLINKKLHRSRVSEDQAAGFLSRNHLRLMDSLAAGEELDNWSLNDLSASSRDLIVFYREATTAGSKRSKHSDEVQVRCDAAKRERDELAKRLESVTAESRQLKRELQASQTECGSLSGRLMQAHEDMQRLGSLLEQTNAEKDAIGEELRKLHGSHQEMGTRLESAASEIDATLFKTRSLETTAGELEQELARSREEGIGLRSRLEQLHRDMELIGALLEKTAAEKQALAVELQKTHVAKAELGLRFDEVNLASQQCQSELDTLRKALGDAESALTEATTERDELSARVQELNGRLRETTTEFENLKMWRKRLEQRRIFRLYRGLQAVFGGNGGSRTEETIDRESRHVDDRT